MVLMPTLTPGQPPRRSCSDPSAVGKGLTPKPEHVSQGFETSEDKAGGGGIHPDASGFTGRFGNGCISANAIKYTAETVC